jgi:ribulose-phosphate 3-epimerase
MSEIVPTILTRDPIDLEKKIQSLSGLVNRVQIDVIDGLFLPEKSISLEDLKPIETFLKLDIHLMVKEPIVWIDRCIDVLADRIIGQVEMMENQEEFIAKAAETAGLGIGLGLDIETPVSAIGKDTLTKLDLVLVMTRKSGFGEFPFKEKVLGKVRELRDLGFIGEICIDGGINNGNIKKCYEAGATSFAVGGAIWQAEDINMTIESLRNLAT